MPAVVPSRSTPACSWPSPRRYRQYTWTDALDRELLNLSHQLGEGAAIRVFEERHGWPYMTVHRRLQKLGARHSRPRRTWTEQEKERLQEMADTSSVPEIARRLHRTVRSVRKQLWVLCQTSETGEGLKRGGLVRLLGVEECDVRRWIRRGWLAPHKGRFPTAMLERFFREHPEEIDFARLPAESKLYLRELGYPDPDWVERRLVIERLKVSRDRVGEWVRLGYLAAWEDLISVASLRSFVRWHAQYIHPERLTIEALDWLRGLGYRGPESEIETDEEDRCHGTV